MTSPQTTPSAQLLSDKWYNRVVQGATLVLPAIQTFYVALALVWGLPYVEQVGGTLAAVNGLLGAIALVAKKIYNASGAGFDGVIIIDEDDEGQQVRLSAQVQDALATKDVVRFAIRR